MIQKKELSVSWTSLLQALPVLPGTVRFFLHCITGNRTLVKNNGGDCEKRNGKANPGGYSRFIRGKKWN